ncbi:MAG: hypothetical protein AB7D36_06525 [Oscillospiraceae bacterium]
MRKKIVAGGILLIAIALLAAGTFAYLVSETRATNVITTGTVELTLTEYSITQGEDGKSERVLYVAPDKILPGETVSKIPVITNTGTASFWTRMKIEIKVDGEVIDDADTYVTIDMDEINWIYKEDGWYYYKSTVEPGEEALPLFDTVTFDSAMGNDFQNKEISIDVVAEAVQSQNNPLTEDGYSDLWVASESIPA